MQPRRFLGPVMVTLLVACGAPTSPTSPPTTGIATPSAPPRATSTPTSVPATGSISVALPYMGHTATRLLDGRVLVAGGAMSWETREPVAAAEIFDPATNQWSTTGTMHDVRSGHIAVLLSDGRVLVAGGEGPRAEALATTELYEPATGSWTTSGAMVAAEGWLAAARLGTGEVLVVSQNHAERYDQERGTWSVTSPWVPDRGNLSSLIVLNNGTALLAGGGANEGCAIESVDLYDPSGDTWTPTGSMLDGHAGATAALLANGRVLVAGGGCESATTAEQYDPILGTWEASCCLIVARAEYTSTQLADGRVLLLGGSAGASGALSYAEVSDSTGSEWVALPNMRLARAGHTATLLSNGKVLVVGGDVYQETASMELYDPRAAR